MANWSGLILTNKGRLLHAKVEAHECQLELTKFKLGAGVLAPGQQLETLTDLIDPQQIVSIATLVNNGDGTVTATGTITNANLETGYSVTELGLFATDPDDGEILYAITIDSNPDYLPAEGGATVVAEEFCLNIAIVNASDVTAMIDITSLATIGNVQSMIANHNTDDAAHADLLHTIQRNTGYAVGDIAYSPNLPSWARLECVTAGTTGDTEPIWSSISAGGGLLSDGSVLWIVDDIRDCTPVGVVRQGLYLPAGYVKANGATVDRADYPRLVRFATVNNLWTSDTTNNAGLFGVGDGTTTMVLPNWVDRMAQFSSDAGASVAAGLPNIKGTITTHAGWYASATGALQIAKTDKYNGTSGSNGYANVTFDASLYNAIYNDSVTTVQPPAIKVLPVLRY